MKEFDIQNIWQSAHDDDKHLKKYTMEDIRIYRSKMSRQTSRSSRLTILFDIGFKSIIALELIYLLTRNLAPRYCLGIGLLLIVIALLIAIEFAFIRKLKSIKETDSVIQNLKNKLNYFTTIHKHFMTLSALSSPLFVVSGFFLYYLFKYDEIRFASPLDDPVMYLFILAAFVISFFAQRPMYKLQVRELKTSINDLDDTIIASIKIEDAKKIRRKYIIIFSIIILIGIFILLVLLNK